MTWQANNAAVMACSSSSEAEAAVMRLIGSGYTAGKISVVARWCSADRQAAACYYLAEHTGGLGDRGRLWASLWLALTGRGVFALPEFGPVLAAGPLVEWIVRALKNAAIFDGFSAVGAALYGIGVSRDAVPEIEAALDLCDVLVIVYGTSREVDLASSVLAVTEVAHAA